METTEQKINLQLNIDDYKYQLILIFQKKKLIVSYLIYDLPMIEILW